jgi:hypothetical protein
MKGGDIYIDVRANYSAMERDLVEAESKAAASAEGAAKQYESKFGGWLQKSAGSVSKKIEGFLNPIQLLDRVADFAERAGEEGIGSALDGLAKSTPIIGAAYRIGTAIGTSLMNAFGAETNEQFAERVEQELADAQARADRQRKIAQGQEAEARQTFGLEQEAGAAEFEAQMRQLERTGQAERAIFLRGLNEEERLQTEMELRVADAANEAQAEAIRRLYEAKIQSNADETRDKLDKQKAADKAAAEARIAEETRAADAIAKAEADASKAAQREQEKADQEAARAREKADAERVKMMEEVARMEEERISSQAAGINGANTALGTFRFDAYPDNDKRRNDERMVRGIEALVANSGTSGGFV